jgi:hypothetical protein
VNDAMMLADEDGANLDSPRRLGSPEKDSKLTVELLSASRARQARAPSQQRQKSRRSQCVTA